MKFTTTKIPGTGGGTMAGFPMLRMHIAEQIPLVLLQGIYAAKAHIKDEHYIGVLMYGPSEIPGEDGNVLGIHLLDTDAFYAGDGETIDIETVKYIRPLTTFAFPELFQKQIEKDVALVRTIFASRA